MRPEPSSYTKATVQLACVCPCRCNKVSSGLPVATHPAIFPQGQGHVCIKLHALPAAATERCCSNVLLSANSSRNVTVITGIMLRN